VRLVSARLARHLARWRVPLGFASAVAALVLARPTSASVALGLAVASVGEAIRIWAAGHLEKSREVTTSGPYRYTRHPLYVGSSVMGAGLAIAARDVVVTALVGAYLAATLTAAIRSEEAFLRERFGPQYEAYTRGAAPTVERGFSLERAWRNHEYRAVLGLALVAALLGVKVAW
jgi:protein-S-isoprenylcysteine O-methyltransferase Ste14